MKENIEKLLSGLVSCNSVNPAWPGGPGEVQVCDFILRVLSSAGLSPEKHEIKPGRINIVCTIPGSNKGSGIMINGHVDVVGIEGMDHPFSLRKEGDKFFGRGAYDMKGGVAIMLAISKACSALRPPYDVHLTFVCDEEDLSIGMEHLMNNWLNSLEEKPFGAIILEPTEEQIGICHKGFGWYEIVVNGKAAHGSRPEEGIDAIPPLGAVINEISAIDEELSTNDPHPLLGHSSIHVGTLIGGTNLPVIAAESRINWERRILPNEKDHNLNLEFERIISAGKRPSDELRVQGKKLFFRSPMETSKSSEIVRRLSEAVPNAKFAGMSYWADSALSTAEGIPSILYGPIGHGAHAIDEWVSASSLERVYETILAVIMGMASNLD